jgi:hypothetical protein
LGYSVDERSCRRASVRVWKESCQYRLADAAEYVGPYAGKRVDDFTSSSENPGNAGTLVGGGIVSTPQSAASVTTFVGAVTQ